LSPPSSPAAAPTDSRIKVAMISSRTGAGIRPLICHLCALADVPNSLSSASPVRGGDGGSVYGGSQLSHTSWDSSHSPAGGHSNLSAISPSSSASGSTFFPFSDLARQRYFPNTGLNSPMQQRLSISAPGNNGRGDSFSEVGSEVSSAVTSLTGTGTEDGHQPSRESYKIVLVGAQKVGKTTLLRLFCDQGHMSSDAAEIDRYEPTIGADCREVACLGAKLQVWDSSGQRKMLALGRSLFKGADGLVLVFDVSESSSFADLDLYLDNFLAHRGKAGGKRGAHGSKDLPMVLVGHKAELGAGTKASRTAQAEAWLRQRNLRCGRYVESSRSNPRSVELVFEAVADFFAPGPGPGEAGADSISSVGSMGSRVSSRAGALPPLQPSSTTLPPLASSIFSWGSAPDPGKGTATSPATGPGAERGRHGRLSPMPSPGATRPHVHAAGSGPARVSRIQDGRPGHDPGQMEERTCMPCSVFSSLW
jgi:signal recognition particle receptor subunit beta